MRVNSIDLRRGNEHPTLVLLGACPGRDEARANPQRPFAGRSGLNLRILLEVLRDLPNKAAYGLHS
jgi:uracil-DNA glycosylase